ncbi:MAG: GGDEF domain-containing protein [Lachnospiraceae bacterium]|nr:GGDEF domain-containing protein [Lachnospiraceae bacterium]
MGYTFSKAAAGSTKGTSERKNVMRIFFGAVIMTLIAIAALVIMVQTKSEEWYGTLSVIVTMYAVGSAAFAGFAVYLLQSKRKKSELWLFKMIYMFAHVSVLLYLSFLVWSHTGSLVLYYFTVILSSCLLLYGKGEYAFFVGIELVLPVLLFVKKALVPEQCFAVVAAHILAGYIVYELYRDAQIAEMFRRKYSLEVKTAEKDPLTGLQNRRGMTRQVESVWPLCERMRQSVAVMVIDVDHFKKYNDRFGHPQGDVCLRKVAEVIRSTAKRKSDLTARIGGEEFLVFLYGMEENQVQFLAEKIRQGVANLQMPHSEEAKYKYVTVSIGVAMERCNADVSFGGLYRRADKELYHAKNTGRNRVSFRGGEISTQRSQNIGVR